MKKQGFIQLSVIIAIIVYSLGSALAVDTQIQTDGSLTGAIPLNINAAPNNQVYAIQQQNGQAVGNNLFYSFNRFNVGSGDTAYFNFTQNWNNVITRVTGGTVSIIDGTLRVSGSRAVDSYGTDPLNVDGVAGATVLNNAAKNFFFINPAGITFGKGSVVDVPGSFYASTSSTLNFSDGYSYRADGTQTNTLSAAAPVSFGFLGNETGALNLDHATIKVFNDETLALVGRDINIDSSTVGMVDLTVDQPAFDSNGQPIFTYPQRFDAREPLFIDGIQLLLLANHSQNNVPLDAGAIKVSHNQLDGNINIKNTDLINAGGDAEEVTFLRGGNITLENASIVSSNYGDDCGGFCGEPSLVGEPTAQVSGIDISAKGAFNLNNGHIVTETSFSPVNPINQVAINIQANSMSMNNNSSISSKSLTIEHITPIYIPQGIIPVYRPVNPVAGDINININSDFVAKGGSSIESSTETFGNAGEIKLTADAITLDNASIKSESLSNTNGLIGYVNDGHNGITFVPKVNPRIDYTRQEDFYLYSVYNSGKQNPTAKDLYANPIIPAPLQETLYNAGNAGKITLIATGGDIKLANGSTVSTNINSGTPESGTAEINLTSYSGSITMDNSTISSSTKGNANAGNINLSANNAIQMSNSSKVDTNSLGLNDSKLGNSGTISINAKYLTMNTGSFISSSTNSLGKAGTVNINTNTVNIYGNNNIPVSQLGHYIDQNFTGIRSMAGILSGGQTGYINILALDYIFLNHGAQISISNQANSANILSLFPSYINMLTPNLYMNNSQIIADSSGNVDASNINVGFTNTLNMQEVSAISTLANNGNGGHIVIKGGNMFWLQNSAVLTSVLGLQGNGGNIDINSNYLIMDSGFIQANTAAKGASGGTVNVNVETIIPSGSLIFIGGDTPFRFQPFSGINVIQAAAPEGIKGQINITTPQLNLSGTLANLILQSFDQNALSRDLCAIGSSSSLAQSGKGNLRRRAKDALLSNTVSQ